MEKTSSNHPENILSWFSSGLPAGYDVDFLGEKPDQQPFRNLTLGSLRLCSVKQMLCDIPHHPPVLAGELSEIWLGRIFLLFIQHPSHCC